jgi:hypothetical protein
MTFAEFRKIERIRDFGSTGVPGERKITRLLE